MLPTMADQPQPRYWTTLRIAIVIFVIAAPIAAALRLWFGYAP